MCRLYGFRANEPTKVECTLVHAQNALMVQSREDLAGKSHANGWGLATYEDHLPHLERQAWAAYHGEHFRRAAARERKIRIKHALASRMRGSSPSCVPRRSARNLRRPPACACRPRGCSSP